MDHIVQENHIVQGFTDFFGETQEGDHEYQEYINSDGQTLRAVCGKFVVFYATGGNTCPECKTRRDEGMLLRCGKRLVKPVSHTRVE